MTEISAHTRRDIAFVAFMIGLILEEYKLIGLVVWGVVRRVGHLNKFKKQLCSQTQIRWSFDEVIDQLLYILPTHFGFLTKRQPFCIHFASVCQTEVFGHLHETDDKFLHPVKGLLIFAQLVCKLKDFQLQFFHLFFQQGDLKGRICLKKSSWFWPHFRRVYAIHYSLGTHNCFFFYFFDGACLVCNEGVDLIFGDGFKFIPEFSYSLIFILIAAFQLVDFFLKKHQDAFLRLDRATVTFHILSFFSLLGSVLVKVMVTDSFLLLSLAL